MVQSSVVRTTSGRGGFTLIELVVVIAILAVLAGIVIPLVSNEVNDARSARAVAEMKTIASAFNSYHTHTGAWPSDASGKPKTMSEEFRTYTCLYANSLNATGWNGPYLNQGDRVNGSYVVAASGSNTGLLDPWGHAYVLQWYAAGGTMGVGGGIAVVCYGPNGKSDTAAAKIAEGEAGGDDEVLVVTRRL